MKVRLTKISDGDHLCVAGATPGPPEVGKPFSVLLIKAERLIVTEPVTSVGFDDFLTADGNHYVWSRVVGKA